jgi:hypothetical protein
LLAILDMAISDIAREALIQKYLWVPALRSRA